MRLFRRGSISRLPAILAISLIGLVDSAFLTHLHLRPEMRTPLCAISSCDTVLASRYSSVMGVSLPSLGIIFYAILGLLILNLLKSGWRPLWGQGLIWSVRCGLLMSAIFLGVQAFVLHAFCLLCCLSGLCCLVLCVLATPGALRGVGSSSLAARRWGIAWLLIALLSPLTFSLFEKPNELTFVDYSRGHVLGALDSKIKVLVFSDFECPYCRQLFQALYPLAQHNQQRLLLCYRPFPIPSHQRAFPAALAAEAAAAQGKYWEYAALLFAGVRLDDSSLVGYARQLGLDISRFESERHSQAVIDRLNAEIQDARDLKILGVPACFIAQKQRAADASAAVLLTGMLSGP